MLATALGDDTAVTAVATHPGARRGGFFEFVLRYTPERAGGWPVGSFARAVRAEGVPVAVDRYTRQGRRAALLPEIPLFTGANGDALGGFLGGPSGDRPGGGSAAPRVVAERMADRLLTLPPLTLVSEQFVRQCAEGLRKVSIAASRMPDPRAA